MSKTIKVENISKHFGNIKAVDDINFSTKTGEIIALLGPNGAGKSTLMNMITTYLAPSSGKISILGIDIKEDPIFIKKNIGFLSEGSPLYPDLTVKAFLSYIVELKDFSGKKKKEELKRVVELAKIENIQEQKIETLSKGYLRRVGFAQSIIGDPKILLLDEPTDGLDPNQKAHIRELIEKMGKDKTIIISTHLLEEAETICNRIILINKGKIMADGTLEEVLKKSKTKELNDCFKKLTTFTEL